MKKAVALFIAILYLAVSSGLAVEIHHCMGKVADFSLNPSKSDKCGSCGMPKDSNSCCKDELKFVKIQDSYKLLNVNYELSIPEADLHHNHFLVNNNALIQFSLADSKGLSPPTHTVSSIYLMNCIFRI